MTSRMAAKSCSDEVTRIECVVSSALTRTGCFPELVLDRVAVGENTGNVVPSLKDIAKTYQKRITRQLNLFTQVIAGAILGGVFIFVGFIAIAMVMAIFQVSASFNKLN